MYRKFGLEFQIVWNSIRFFFSVGVFDHLTGQLPNCLKKLATKVQECNPKQQRKGSPGVRRSMRLSFEGTCGNCPVSLKYSYTFCSLIRNSCTWVCFVLKFLNRWFPVDSGGFHRHVVVAQLTSLRRGFEIHKSWIRWLIPNLKIFPAKKTLKIFISTHKKYK